MHLKTLILLCCVFLVHAYGLCDTIKPQPPAKQISMYVGDADGQIIAEENAETKLAPASVTKLLTSFVALKQLGVDYKFRTSVYYRNVKGKNQLAIVGTGDPVFNSETLYAMISQIKARGVKEIDTLILDDSAFIETKSSKGNRAYQAGTSALSINNNSEEVFACRPIGTSSVKSCSSTYRSVDDVRQSFESILRLMAERALLKIEKIKYESIQENLGDYSLLYENFSPPLPKILFDLNHFSTNMIAEQLVFAIGENGRKYSFELGLKRIKDTLELIGVKDIELFDGSGLSNRNRISAKQIFLVLYNALSDAKIAPEFLSSLSIANVSGTLKKRHFDEQLFFRGKTGSLEGVVAVAGYLTTKSRKQLMVVSLQNGVTDPDRAKSWEESFLERVSETH